MTETMSAVVLTGHGGLDKLVFRQDWPKPLPKASEVLIKVGACGLNNTDVNTRSGWYAKSVRVGTTGESFDTADEAAWGGSLIDFPRIQGADVCGTAEAVGADAPRGLVGRRVLVDTWLRDWNDPDNLNKTGYFGSECDGGFAQWVCVDHHNVHAVESTLSDAELATFATSYVTAENMLNRANVGPDDTVLITGASGGVGSALIQLANRRGATTLAMCGDDKADAVAAVGPKAVLPRAPSDLKAALGGEKVTVVADIVGGPIWPQLIEVLERGGRYTCAGAIAGPIVEFDLRTFYLNDLTFTGATIVPPGTFADLVRYIERDEIRPLLAETYPLERLVDAQIAFMAKRHIGNIAVLP